MPTKICSKCRIEKSLDSFGVLREKDGLHPWCKSCKQKSEKSYYDRSDSAKKKRTVYNRKRKYGITLEEYEQLLISQNSCCAICKIHLDTSTTNLSGHVDHCHETGKIRGLLCGQCNVGLGHFYENEDSLLNAIQYLRKYK